MTLAPEQIKEIDKIIRKTAVWPVEAITLLIGRLACSRNYDPDFEITDEQIAEIQRCIEEVESGKVKPLTREEAEAKVRRDLERGVARAKKHIK